MESLLSGVLLSGVKLCHELVPGSYRFQVSCRMIPLFVRWRHMGPDAINNGYDMYELYVHFLQAWDYKGL